MRKKGLTQGNPEYATLSTRSLYAVTNVKIKTPKSILLPTMIKSLPNNTELINVLNRLGHSISYSTLMESQTENAFQILDYQLRSGCIIPEECQADSFTIFVADNIDRNEETLSGKSLFKVCVLSVFMSHYLPNNHYRNIIEKDHSIQTYFETVV